MEDKFSRQYLDLRRKSAIDLVLLRKEQIRVDLLVSGLTEGEINEILNEWRLLSSGKIMNSKQDSWIQQGVFASLQEYEILASHLKGNNDPELSESLANIGWILQSLARASKLTKEKHDECLLNLRIYDEMITPIADKAIQDRKKVKNERKQGGINSNWVSFKDQEKRDGEVIKAYLNAIAKKRSEATAIHSAALKYMEVSLEAKREGRINRQPTSNIESAKRHVRRLLKKLKNDS